MFPELENVEIDETAENKESVLYNEIIKWLELGEDEEQKKKKINVGDRVIICKLRRIYVGLRRKFIGYSVELIDNTNEDNYIKLLNNYNADLSKQVEEKTDHIRHMQNSIITGMATMVESRDNSTGGHVRRTSECVKVFANAIKWKKPEIPVKFLANIIKAAPMHDLGKIAVDDQILRKPGKFTDEEYAIMKTHSAKGAYIVSQVLAEVQDESFKEIAINVAHYHHEKWDGNGYPEGISGTDIPLEARIMALADVFDALVSKRCYKEAFNYDRAFNIIEESLGSHFDPELGQIFLECRPKLEKLYDEMPE
jgi:HD-GYP domain-containing protein (c-di-GMP phosphodiesterase class II)